MANDLNGVGFVLFLYVLLYEELLSSGFQCDTKLDDPNLCISNQTCETFCCDGWVKDDQGRCSKCVPVDYSEPTIIGCPKRGESITVFISKDQNIGLLPNPFIAYDWKGDRLHVWLMKQMFIHCLCTIKHENVTAISEKDAYGNTAICQFVVTIMDDTKPVFRNCPPDQRITDKDNITWLAPTVRDNVGIQTVLGPDPSINNTRMRHGVYKLTYNATDWAGNMADCTFHITVLNTGPDIMTQSTLHETMMISGTIVGALLIIVGVTAVAMIHLCKKRRQVRQHTSRVDLPLPNTQDTSNNNFNSIYYSDPPPYEIVESHKLPEYSPSDNPPSYEDINIQQPCESQSEREVHDADDTSHEQINNTDISSGNTANVSQHVFMNNRHAACTSNQIHSHIMLETDV